MPCTRIPKPSIAPSDAELERAYFGGEGWQTVEVTGGGGGLPTGWTQDGSDPANVSGHGGSLSFDDGDVEVVLGPNGIRVDSIAGDPAFGISQAGGVQSMPYVGVPAFTALSGAGATVALDAGGLRIINTNGLYVVSDGDTDPILVQNGLDNVLIVDAGGAVTIRPTLGTPLGTLGLHGSSEAYDILFAEDYLGNNVFELGPLGGVILTPSDGGAALTIKPVVGFPALTTFDAGYHFQLFTVSDHGGVAVRTDDGVTDLLSLSTNILDTGVEVVKVGPTGAVTISPSDPDAVPLTVRGSDSVNEVFRILASGELVSQPGGGGIVLDINTDAIGFYGTAAIAKQTGVAVSAAGIHAALVNLGLISA